MGSGSAAAAAAAPPPLAGSGALVGDRLGLLASEWKVQQSLVQLLIDSLARSAPVAAASDALRARPTTPPEPARPPARALPSRLPTPSSAAGGEAGEAQPAAAGQLAAAAGESTSAASASAPSLAGASLAGESDALRHGRDAERCVAAVNNVSSHLEL